MPSVFILCPVWICCEFIHLRDLVHIKKWTAHINSRSEVVFLFYLIVPFIFLFILAAFATFSHHNLSPTFSFTRSFSFTHSLTSLTSIVSWLQKKRFYLCCACVHNIVWVCICMSVMFLSFAFFFSLWLSLSLFMCLSYVLLRNMVGCQWLKRLD